MNIIIIADTHDCLPLVKRATDRLSAFALYLENITPDKGELLNMFKNQSARHPVS